MCWQPVRCPAQPAQGDFRVAGGAAGVTAIQHYGDVRTARGDLVEEHAELLVDQVRHPPAVRPRRAAVGAHERLQRAAGLGLPVTVGNRLLTTVAAEPQQRDVTRSRAAEMVADPANHRRTGGLIIEQHLLGHAAGNPGGQEFTDVLDVVDTATEGRIGVVIDTDEQRVHGHGATPILAGRRDRQTSAPITAASEDLPWDHRSHRQTGRFRFLWQQARRITAPYGCAHPIARERSARIYVARGWRSERRSRCGSRQPLHDRSVASVSRTGAATASHNQQSVPRMPCRARSRSVRGCL